MSPHPDPTAIELRNFAPRSAVTSPSPPQREERDGERKAFVATRKTPLPNPLPASQGEGEGRILATASLNSMAVHPDPLPALYVPVLLQQRGERERERGNAILNKKAANC